MAEEAEAVEQTDQVAEKMTDLVDEAPKEETTEPEEINHVAQESTEPKTEEKIERKRKKKNDPRTCDIDIIDYKNKVIDFNFNKLKFSVPHKNLKHRNFVLFPLIEILPDWKHPESKENVATLLKNLPEEDRKSILMVKKN